MADTPDSIARRMNDAIDSALKSSKSFNESISKSNSSMTSLQKSAKLFSDQQNLINEQASKLKEIQNSISNKDIEIKKVNLQLDKLLLANQIEVEKLTEAHYFAGNEEKSKLTERLDLVNSIFKSEKQSLVTEKGRLLNLEFIGKKLADTLQESITEGDNRKEINKTLEKQQSIISKITTAFGETGTRVKAIFDLLVDIMETPLGIMLALLTDAMERFVAIDKAAESFRKTTGLLASQSQEINNIIQNTSREYAYLGVTAEDVAKNAGDIATVFNENMSAVKLFTGQVSLLQSNFGVAAVDSAKVLQTFIGLGKMSTSTAKALQMDVVNLARMSGVAPSKVMKDIANASETTLIALRGNVVELAKGAVAARKMGTSIEAITGSMSSVLDFDSSINKEMEMSVLLGKHISLNSLRRAAYSGSALDYERELQKTVRSIGDLQGKSPFQIKAISDALGISVQELTKMSAFQQLSYEDQQKQLALQAKQQEMQSEINQLMSQLSAMAMDLAEILLPIVKVVLPIMKGLLIVIGGLVKLIVYPFVEFGKMLSNAYDYLSDISNKFEGIKKFSISVNDVFSKIVQRLETWHKTTQGIIFAFNILMGAVGAYYTYAIAKSLILTSIESARWAMNKMGWITTIASSSTFFVSSIAGWLAIKIAAVSAWVASMGPISLLIAAVVAGFSLMIYYWDEVSKFAKKFGMLLGPIGIMVSFIANVMDRWKETPKGFLGGLQAIGEALFDTLIAPFQKSYNWIMSFFGGHSPSKLGLSIVKGISSVGGMLISALSAPFKKIMNMKDILMPFVELAKIGPELWTAASGITAIGAALAAETFIGAISNIVKKLTGNPFKPIIELAGFAPQMQLVAESMGMMAEFGDAAAESISNMAKSVTELSKALNDLNMNNLTALDKLSLNAGVNSTPVNTNTNNGTGNGDKIENKLDELIGLMKSGAIAVNIDGQLASKYIAKALA